MDYYPLTRAGLYCPMCLTLKEKGLIVHWGECYHRTGFKDGDLLALNVVEAYETYLQAVVQVVGARAEEVTA